MGVLLEERYKNPVNSTKNEEKTQIQKCSVPRRTEWKIISISLLFFVNYNKISMSYNHFQTFCVFSPPYSLVLYSCVTRLMVFILYSLCCLFISSLQVAMSPLCTVKKLFSISHLQFSTIRNCSHVLIGANSSINYSYPYQVYMF